jgi:hypothetical protein
MEVLLRYLRTCTPNVLMMPWEMSTAAYMPMVLPAVGSYADFTVAVVEIRPARPKDMPVVTATWPRKLNLEVCVSYCCIVAGKRTIQ